MNVLWICNILFPEVEGILSESAVSTGGGWMIASAAQLSKAGVALTVSTVTEKVKSLTHIHGKDFDYYLLPYGSGNKINNHEYDAHWIEVSKRVKPDVVHIHGSEFTHGLSYVQSVGPDHVVVSLQGLMGEYSKCFFDGMSKWDVISCTSLRDIIKKDTLFSNHGDYLRRSEYEKLLLKSVKHVIGRTEWDHDVALKINPKLIYHFCNETLRPEFYDGHWKHNGNRQIFISQANYPIKGFHQLVKAIGRMDNPPKVVVAGYNPTDDSSLVKRLKQKSYGIFINRLIKKYELQDTVSFCGPLNPAEIKKAYLESDAFICPSAIENSSNSIGEAQLLGVPVIATRRGGTPSIIENGRTGYLYDFDDLDSLVALIEKTLNSDCADMSQESKQKAGLRHDPALNNSRLIDIYTTISHSC